MKIFIEAEDVPFPTVGEFWNETANTTINELGANDALKIDTVHLQNWIDIADWLTDEYAVDSLENDIMMLYFIRFYSELQWLQIFFLTGNYLELYRSLRYDLEAIAQAYEIHQQLRSHDVHLGDQIESLIMEIEESGQRTQDLIEKVVTDVLDEDEEVIEEQFFGSDEQYRLWDKLNKSVHPSGIDIAHRLSRDAKMLYWNKFNKAEAMDALSATDAVFDVVTVVILKTYSEIQQHATDSSEFPRSEDLYYTNQLLE